MERQLRAFGIGSMSDWFRKLASKPTFDGRELFKQVLENNIGLAAVHMQKNILVFDNPIYVGMSILDLSKHIMYDFHCNYMKSTYGPNTKLLFKNTNSLACQMFTDYLWQDRQHFDQFGYPHDSKYYDPTNKKLFNSLSKLRMNAMGSR